MLAIGTVNKSLQNRNEFKFGKSLAIKKRALGLSSIS
jgi:hypothetical protein